METAVRRIMAPFRTHEYRWAGLTRIMGKCCNIYQCKQCNKRVIVRGITIPGNLKGCTGGDNNEL
ncbi:hypothetical protein D3C81_1144310 [compost metagenome]